MVVPGAPGHAHFDFSSCLVYRPLQSPQAGVSLKLWFSVWREDRIEWYMMWDSGSQPCPWF